MKNTCTQKITVFLALFFTLAISAIPVVALSKLSTDKIDTLNFRPTVSNINITERELPFSVTTHKKDANSVLFAFPDSISGSVMMKRIEDEEIIPVQNNVYVLDIDHQYCYSVSIKAPNATEYYNAIFTVSTESPNYILYSNIVKNVTYPEHLESEVNTIIGYTTISELEPANNSVSGAVLTFSDADNKGVISNSNDVDWWKVKFNYTGKANFWLGDIPTGCNYKLTIYNASGTVQLANSNNPENNPELITLSVRKGVYYTIKVSCASGYNATSKYLFRIKNYPDFSDNAVYKIKNTNYSKYISVKNGYNANGQNVEIDSVRNESDAAYTNNQRMRINYYPLKEAYTISPICSYNGHGRALDIYNTGSIENGANVQIWKAQDVANQAYADEQYFTFEESGSGIVIRLKYFTDLVLNANSSNVFVCAYGATSSTQRWVVEEDADYNDMERKYKEYGWKWMYYSGNNPNNLNFSSSYGKRYYLNKDESHYAIDIPANNNTTVYSATNGIATQVGYKSDIQYFVVVKTDDSVYNNSNTKLRILYQHMSTEPSVVSGGSVSQQVTQIGKTGQGHMHYCIITDGGNRLEAEDFSPVHNNTSWHTQYFSNTTNPLLFYDWNDWGFTYN